ncbi:MAG: class II fructose-bisphosphate aldolase [Brevinema sp.]
MKELLVDAKHRGYALGAFNITSITYLHAIFDAAQEVKSPVVVSISERHVDCGFLHLEATANYFQTLCNHYSIPVVLHFDHGESLGMIQRAINCGFHSVMIDRSHDSLEKNILDTQQVVMMALLRDVAVEGELGLIGGKEGDGNINESNSQYFTDPSHAYKYTLETGVDSLAVAIGNVHGRYKGTPNLDFERLQEISSLLSIPLVLHGGSGISDEKFQQLIKKGIHKINYYSGNFLPSYESCEKFLHQEEAFTKDIGELFWTIYIAVKQNIMSQLTVFGSEGKA